MNRCCKITFEIIILNFVKPKKYPKSAINIYISIVLIVGWHRYVPVASRYQQKKVVVASFVLAAMTQNLFVCVLRNKN